MELLAGMVVADRFRLDHEIGKGGMGAVWLARHLGLDVPCAIKFILAQAAAAPEILERFEREAKAAAHIKSPYVVQILDYGVWQGMPYLAMEYLEGEDLGVRLARRGRLDARETATIVGQAAHALGKAHAMGIVHRDVKPSNIFLVRDEDREIAKVVDFGIAKSHSRAIGEGHTRTGALIGTPFYMSPEQAQGQRAVDHRSDLWALGVVAFQCLTGRLPFESDGLGELVMKIVVHPIPVPSQLALVPPGFDAWWARAVARDPAQRFQSARELSEALYLALGISASSVADLRDNAAPPAPAARGAALASTPEGVMLPLADTPRPRRAHRAAMTIAGVLLLAGAGALVVLLRPAWAPAPTSAAAPVSATEQAAVAPPIASPDVAAPPDAGGAASAAASASASARPAAAPPPRPRRSPQHAPADKHDFGI